MKICSACHISKPFTDFFLDKATRDGHRNPCKQCINTRPVQKRPKTLEESFSRFVPTLPGNCIIPLSHQPFLSAIDVM